MKQEHIEAIRSRFGEDLVDEEVYIIMNILEGYSKLIATRVDLNGKKSISKDKAALLAIDIIVNSIEEIIKLLNLGEHNEKQS